MKFKRLRTVALPLSRQLTTSTAGYRTGSTPASFTPRTSASEVPPPLAQVGLTSAGVFATPGGVGEASVGTISVSLPPTWNAVPAPFTQAACTVGGEAAASTPRRTLTTTPTLRTRVLLIVPSSIGGWHHRFIAREIHAGEAVRAMRRLVSSSQPIRAPLPRWQIRTIFTPVSIPMDKSRSIRQMADNPRHQSRRARLTEPFP